MLKKQTNSHVFRFLSQLEQICSIFPPQILIRLNILNDLS